MMLQANAESRPTVVCLHASAGSPRQWQALGQSLSPQFDVLTPGLIGYFGGAAMKGKTVLLEEEAENIIAQIGHINEPFHLVGHSYGGAVATQLALQYPERVASLSVYEPAIFSLILEENRYSEGSMEIRRVGDFVLHNATSAQRQEAASWRFINYWSGPGTWEWLDESQKERFLRMIPKIAAEFSALKNSSISAELLHKLDIPVQLICGSETRASARGVASILCRSIAHIETGYLRGGTHMAPVTHADLVNPMICGFLRRQVCMPVTRAA